MAGLTDMQAAFVGYFVSNGGNGAAAARSAGYATPNQAAYGLLRLDHVQAAIGDAQRRLVDGELTSAALGVLAQVLADESAPAAVRVTAAKAILERSAIASTPRRRASEAPLHEMTAAELAAAIAETENLLQSLTD